MKYRAEDGERKQHGPALNELTSSAHRDTIAATPFHKHVIVEVAPATESPSPPRDRG